METTWGVFTYDPTGQYRAHRRGHIQTWYSEADARASADYWNLHRINVDRESPYPDRGYVVRKITQ